MSTPLPTSESRWFRRFSLGYSAVCIALLAYFVIAWRGWFGVAPLSQSLEVAGAHDLPRDDGIDLGYAPTLAALG